MTSSGTVKRKLKRNLGVVPGEGDPSQAPDSSSNREPVLMPERLIRTVLEDATNKLKNDKEEATRFFSFFFDPSVPVDERDEFVTNFMQRPPRSVLGYPRSGAELPTFAVVSTSDDEDDEFLGQFADEEAGEEYVQSFFTSVYSVYVCAGHPIQAMYLYQFAKSVLLSAKLLFLSLGAQSVHLSGGELAPDEGYLPENMYIRVARVTIKAPASVPRFQPADPTRLRLAGIFAHDVVVDGQAGGVNLKGEFDGSEEESD